MENLTTSGKRLTFLILNVLKVKPLQFSKRVGINSTYLSQLRNQHKPFTVSVAYKISEAYPNVNTNWIFTGTGEPIKQTDSHAQDLPQVNEKQAEYTAGAIALDDVPGLLRSLLSRVKELEERVQYLENRKPGKGQVQENQKNKSAE